MNPFALEAYKEEQIESKLRQETKRAPVKKKPSKVNPDVDPEAIDSRFHQLFMDKEFHIDPTNERAQQLKPVGECFC